MTMHDYEVEEGILKTLLKNEGLKTLIDDKIFPVYIEEGTEGDAVYYDSELGDPETCKMGNVTNVMHLYICAVSSSMDNSNRIIGVIQDILEGEYKDPYMRIRAVGSAKDGANFKYAKTMDFLIEW